MKTIGIIGGMSWESTTTYYNIINKTIGEKLGGLHSAKIILYSVDFYDIEKNQQSGDWDSITNTLIPVAKLLENAGADFIIIATNTIHKVYDEVLNAVNIPIIHIADTTAEEILKTGIKTVGLLGTRYTMEQDFYKKRLISKDINTIIPNKEDISIVNSIIFDELCMGIVSDKSQKKLWKIIEKLIESGAEGIILGCTELGLIIKPEDVSVSVFDTALIHGIKAGELAI